MQLNKDIITNMTRIIIFREAIKTFAKPQTINWIPPNFAKPQTSSSDTAYKTRNNYLPTWFAFLSCSFEQSVINILIQIKNIEHVLLFSSRYNGTLKY